LFSLAGFILFLFVLLDRSGFFVLLAFRAGTLFLGVILFLFARSLLGIVLALLARTLLVRGILLLLAGTCILVVILVFLGFRLHVLASLLDGQSIALSVLFEDLGLFLGRCCILIILGRVTVLFRRRGTRALLFRIGRFIIAVMRGSLFAILLSRQ